MPPKKSRARVRKYPCSYLNYDIKFFILFHQRHPHRTRCQRQAGNRGGVLRNKGEQHTHRLWWQGWQPGLPGDTSHTSPRYKRPIGGFYRGGHRRRVRAHRRWVFFNICKEYREKNLKLVCRRSHLNYIAQSIMLKEHKHSSQNSNVFHAIITLSSYLFCVRNRFHNRKKSRYRVFKLKKCVLFPP